MDHRSELRAYVRGAYDLQKMRIEMGNRLVGNFKAKLGQSAGVTESELEEDAKEILRILRDAYDKITDGVVGNLPRAKGFKGTPVISSFVELALVDQYVAIDEAEKRQFARFPHVLAPFRIWTDYLLEVRGCGPAMSGVIISEIDIHKARYPSSLYRYAGLDVGSDGRGRSRRQEHLIDVEYTNKNGEKANRKGITFNPWLKTKLVGVLGSSFIKQPADKCKYRQMYDDYKHRLESHPKYGLDVDSKGHRHNMAVRYIVKAFLADLYKVWREMEGLEVFVPYGEAKLGIVHKGGEEAA